MLVLMVQRTRCAAPSHGLVCIYMRGDDKYDALHPWALAIQQCEGAIHQKDGCLEAA